MRPQEVQRRWQRHGRSRTVTSRAVQQVIGYFIGHCGDQTGLVVASDGIYFGIDADPGPGGRRAGARNKANSRVDRILLGGSTSGLAIA